MTDRSSRELWESLNVMIDCARPAQKKPNVLLLASASTHHHPRLPFVNPPPLRHPTFASTTGSDPILDVRPPILPLASSHPHYVHRRYRLHLVEIAPSSHPPKCYYVAHARTALRSYAWRRTTSFFYLKSLTHRFNFSPPIVFIFLQNEIFSRYWISREYSNNYIIVWRF